MSVKVYKGIKNLRICGTNWNVFRQHKNFQCLNILGIHRSLPIKRFIVCLLQYSVIIAFVLVKLCRLSVWLLNTGSQNPWFIIWFPFSCIINFVGTIDKPRYNALRKTCFYFLGTIPMYIRKIENGFSFTCCSWISWKKLGISNRLLVVYGKDVNTPN